MKKALVMAAAASAMVAGLAISQPADAQIVHRHHGYYGGHYGWGWNNPVAFGAGAIVGTAAAIATAPLWAAAAPVAYDYGYGYNYGYDYGYADPIYAPAPVVYAAPRRVVYTQRVAPRRVVYTSRVVAPRRVISQRTVVRTAPRPGVRTVVYR